MIGAMFAGEPTGTRDQLRDLLQEYNEHPDDRDRVLADIDRLFRRTVAVLVLDTCGFSRRVRELGIVHFLALLERMERVVRPDIEAAGGRILRREADNLFAVFEDAGSAVQAARTVQRGLRAANEALPEADELGASIGIGFGEVLLVGDDDVWGDEMNLASKLGEDLAECGEILVTPATREAVTDPDVEFEDRSYSASGLGLPAYRVPE
jgi:class 3 adenylate cyclase